MAPELANLPEMPDGAWHVWEWYSDLSGARSTGMAVNAISWSDIDAYFRLRRIQPERWEVDAIRALDDAFLASRLDKVNGAVKGAGALKQRMTGKAAD